MDEQNRNAGTGGGLDRGMTERTGVSGAGSSADLPGNVGDRAAMGDQGNTWAGSAGAANTPSFGATGSTGGGMEGRSAGGGSQGSETERALEEARDTLTRDVTESAQQAASQATERLKEDMGEQMKNVATAVQHDAKSAAREKVGQVGHQVEDQTNRAMDRAASGLETAANRLDQVADERLGGQTGARARVGDAAHQAADTLEGTARYLRENDVRGVQNDLERMTREKPVQMVLGALAVGWLLGKILR